jgi:flagellar assembly factor FliW
MPVEAPIRPPQEQQTQILPKLNTITKSEDTGSVAEQVQDTVFEFPEGISAFEEAKRFELLISEEIKPFAYFQSLDVEGLGFVCIDPFLVHPSYLVEISPQNMEFLDLAKPEDAMTLSFVTVAGDPVDTTVDLLAPIVINVKNLRGRQIILEDYPVRYNIWQGVQALKKTA